jgi:MiaB-like tRNA modifying enzyme
MLKPRILLLTYGCAFNQSDSDAMRALLSASGFAEAESERNASAIVLNTCTVKGATEHKTLDLLRRLSAQGKRLVVAGCLAQANPAAVRKAAPGAVLVGTRAIGSIPAAVRAALAGSPGEFFSGEEGRLSLPRAHSGAIARIPIAEGCLGACAYCQTKLARGGLKSYPPGVIGREAEKCLAAGCRELQLTAQDCGAYGLDIGSSLPELVARVSSIGGEFRVRVGMANPDHVKKMLPALLEAFGHENVYKFLHVPVQCGSDRVLGDMGRRYSASDFAEIVARFREAFLESVVATDIIAGFPTETESDFAETLALLSETRPDVTNVSRFTPRPFTRAAALKMVPGAELKRRTSEVAALCRRISRENNEARVGKTFRVLVTERQRKGMSARTDSYRQVALSHQRQPGSFCSARISRATNSALFE